jgi:hypothetical protein
MNNENKKEISQEEFEEYQQLKSMFEDIKEGISGMNDKMDR